ncbi:dihydrolipoyl dehydrogenase [Candidatus Woesearchaeota archaeon]|nr:dihydrolipoyl dehydrogenase [Candidatus Woesearchaeota archaeon]
MKDYDVIVIGSGSGMNIIQTAVSHGMKAALVDYGPVGGTCLNVGCIPSKMLIAGADRIMEIREAVKFGIDAEIKSIDFNRLMEEMRQETVPQHEEILRNLKSQNDFDFYDGDAHFVRPYELKIGDEHISGKRIFIASGSRPFIPKQFRDYEFLTNETLLDLKTLPKKIVIIGGGFIAVEYAHFFSAMGSKVTIVQKNNKLVPHEDPEISKILEEELSKRMTIYTGAEVKKLSSLGCVLQDGTVIECHTSKIIIAVGRMSNADRLQVENSGIETDERGFIKVDNSLETSKENIFAFGDAIGKAMFTHAANQESAYAWHNAMHDHKIPFEFLKVPHAVYTWPQIASVGLTENKAGNAVRVGKAKYSDVAKGSALREKKGFAKCIIKDNKLMGFHLIGPYAPMLIQEAVNAMGKNITEIANSMHIHPSMSEVMQKAVEKAS